MSKTRIKDDPVRLRQCLQALSDACGHNVFRFEVTMTDTGGSCFIVTAPRETQEESIAKLIAVELRRHYKQIELDDSDLPSVAGDGAEADGG